MRVVFECPECGELGLNKVKVETEECIECDSTVRLAIQGVSTDLDSLFKWAAAKLWRISRMLEHSSGEIEISSDGFVIRATYDPDDYNGPYPDHLIPFYLLLQSEDAIRSWILASGVKDKHKEKQEQEYALLKKELNRAEQRLEKAVRQAKDAQSKADSILADASQQLSKYKNLLATREIVRKEIEEVCASLELTLEAWTYTQSNEVTVHTLTVKENHTGHFRQDKITVKYVDRLAQELKALWSSKA